MILLDTSIVVDFARGKDKKLLAILPTVPSVICGVVRAELLCGARGAQHRTNLLTLLAAFNHISIPESLWDRIGDHLAALRGAGVTVPFADIVIATLAVENGFELWKRDNHFSQILPTMPNLRLFQEPCNP